MNPRAGQTMVTGGRRRISPAALLFLSMLAGISIGYFFPSADHPRVAEGMKAASDIFLNLIKCIIVPLLFSTLVVGIAGHSDDLKAVGRLALKALIYFEVVTTMALVVGLLAVNLARPGMGVTLPAENGTGPDLAKPRTLLEIIVHVAPASLIESAARNDVLQVVVFAILFAVALTRVTGKPREIILQFLDALSQVMFKFTGLVMKLAPMGVAAAMAVAVGKSGAAGLKHLGLLVLTFYAALAVFLLAVLLPIALLARIPLFKFLAAVKEPALIAFTTTSSDAALPLALERMMEFGVPKRIVSFVLPAGYTFNLDGSTLYLAVTSVFAAQAAGRAMSLGDQLAMMLTLMLTSKGVAAVPRASLVVLSGTLVTFGLPIEVVALILGVDAIMDMARTSVNLVGNCLASAVMARWESGLARDQDPEKG